MVRLRSMLPPFELVAACCVAFMSPAGIPLEARSPQQETANSIPAPIAAHQAVLKRYCVTCHNQRLRTAQLTLDTVEVQNPGR